jgi:hypothetical protein
VAGSIPDPDHGKKKTTSIGFDQLQLSEFNEHVVYIYTPSSKLTYYGTSPF